MVEALQTSTGSRELTGYRLCRSCHNYLVEPDDVYSKAERKGEQHDNCRKCRKHFTRKTMPKRLVVPKQEKALYKSQEATSNSVQQWLIGLTAKQESVLLHTTSTTKQLPKGMQTSDIAHATHRVHWNAVEERLRDIYSLERLFKGFESLMKTYKTEINTVHPIGLIAVSLNNCAARSSQPFKFSWIQGCVASNESESTTTLTISFEAWSTSEKEFWNVSTPSQRLKQCSVWESSIQSSASTMLVPYKHIDAYSIGVNRDTKNSSIQRIHNCLVWAKEIVDDQGNYKPGELLFPQDRLDSPRTQINSSAKLLFALAQAFHIRSEHKTWQSVREHILEAIHKTKDPGNKERAKFKELLDGRRNRVYDGLKINKSKSSIDRKSVATLKDEGKGTKRKEKACDQDEKTEFDKGNDVDGNDEHWKNKEDAELFRPAKRARFTNMDNWLMKSITRR